MRFKSCFRGLTAPSLRSKLGYTCSVGPRDRPVFKSGSRRSRRKPWNTDELRHRMSEGPTGWDQVTGKVFEIHERSIGTCKKLAGPSDLGILFSWSHPGPPARTPRPWLGSLSARLGLRQRQLPFVHADRYVSALKSATDRLTQRSDPGLPVPTSSIYRCAILKRRRKGHGHVVAFTVENQTLYVWRDFHTSHDWQRKLTDNRDSGEAET